MNEKPNMLSFFARQSMAFAVAKQKRVNGGTQTGALVFRCSTHFDGSICRTYQRIATYIPEVRRAYHIPRLQFLQEFSPNQ